MPATLQHRAKPRPGIDRVPAPITRPEADSDALKQDIRDRRNVVDRSKVVATAKTVLPTLVILLLAPFAGASVALTLLFAGAVYLSSSAAQKVPYPIDLIPASRLAMTLAGPVIGILIAIGIVYIGEGALALPGSLISVAVAATLTATVTDYIGRYWIRRKPTRVAVIGSLKFARGLRKELQENGIEDVEMVGWLNLNGHVEAKTRPGINSPLRRAVIEHGIDVLVHETGSDVFGPGSQKVFEQAAEDCADLPVRLISGSRLYERLFGHIPMGIMNSAFYLYVSDVDFKPPNPGAKRVMDLVIGSLAGLVAGPLLALAAIAIKLEDRGPVFYRQTRIGQGGREFDIYKLRTMVVDAQAKGAQWSSANDNRVTRVGRLLRRLHLDELPQLRNVFDGTMTLVGPRPEQPKMVAELEASFDHYSRRHLVKPGVTGWAQVRCGYGGSVVGTAWKTCHDLYYLKHRTLATDLLIILETLVGAARDSHRAIRVPDSQFLAGFDLGLEPEVAPQPEPRQPTPLPSPDQRSLMPRPGFNFDAS